MDPGRWLRACALFERVVELAPTERTAFLQNAFERDRQVRRLVQRMVTADGDRANGVDRLMAALGRARDSGAAIRDR